MCTKKWRLCGKIKKVSRLRWCICFVNNKASYFPKFVAHDFRYDPRIFAFCDCSGNEKFKYPLNGTSSESQCWRSRVQLRVTSSVGRPFLNLGSIKMIKIEFCVCPSVKSKRPVFSEWIKQLPHLSRNSWSLRSYEVFKFMVNTSILTTSASDIVNLEFEDIFTFVYVKFWCLAFETTFQLEFLKFHFYSTELSGTGIA